MLAPSDDHKFNDDLLLHEEDRKLALLKYPSIFHVLDHPELRQLFSKYDVRANRAKHTGLMAGIWAIGFGFGALGIAALELLYAENTTHGLALAIISGLFGVLSFLIGSVGVLFAGRKRNWLRCRLMGEKIRQFHFQMLAFRLPEILASLKDDAAKTSFLSERKSWFETFKAQLIGKLDSAFAAIIQEEQSINPWLFGDVTKQQPAADMQEDKGLNALFDAYRELRIVHQLDFTNYKLQDDHRVVSAMPRRQMVVISSAVFTLIVLLVIMHVGILAGALFPSSMFAAFHSPEAIVVIIWLALAALAARALEQGLQPEREIERYQQYRSGVRAILERYDNAVSQNGKIGVMREMERLAFEEMRNFLVTNERSRFVM
jgi:hypothetical protein